MPTGTVKWFNPTKGYGFITEVHTDYHPGWGVEPETVLIRVGEALGRVRS